MTRQSILKNLLTISLLVQTISVAIGQTDSLTQQKTLVKLDSAIRRNYGHKNDLFADSLLATALTQSKARIGANSASYAYFLSLKGQILLRKGLYKEAIPLFEEARIDYQRIPLDSNRIENLTQLAQTYSIVGPLKNAQEVMLEAEEAFQLPGNWKGFPQILIWEAKAKIYLKLFDFKQAVSYQQRVVDRYIEIGGGFYDRYYPEAAANLASLLSILQRDEEALTQIQQVKSYLHKERPDDAVLWKVYIAEGQISLRQKDYDRAEASFLQALLMATQQTSDNSIWSTMTYNLLASFYRTSRKDADRAEYYFSLSQSSLKKIGMTNDFLTARALNDLALLHFQKGQYRQATTELAESQRLLRTEQQSNFGFTAARQKEIETRSNQEPFINAISFAAHLVQQGKKPDTLLRQLSYDAALYLNGLLLDDTRQMRQTLVNSGDTAVRRLYTTWVALKQTAADSLANPSRLNGDIDRLEQQMARLSTAYATGKAQSRVNWRQISETLQSADAAITFVRFPAFDASVSPADSILYAALIIRPRQTAPDLVVLCSERQLLATLTRRQQPTPLYVSRGTELGGTQHPVEASAFYRLLWQPLVSALPGVKRIYYSPGGLLHGISMAGLRIPAGKTAPPQYLIDRYELRQLFSTREIVSGSSPLRRVAKQSAVLVGGVDYGIPAGDTPFDPLPGSEREVAQISRLFNNARVLRRGAARESELKALSSHSPAILHLATHGFYRPGLATAGQPASNDPSRSYPSVLTDPLQRSGLALAGANYAPAESNRAIVADDGILTAYEVALLDLSQTRLVVLSACETALGDVEGGEGVYGLQRAFRLAGADKLIVSLRPVPDQATQHLMTLFYTYLQKGADVHVALRQAQQHLRQRYPDPVVWAAFVLIE